MQSLELADVTRPLPPEEALTSQIADAIESAVDFMPAVEQATAREAASPHMQVQATLIKQIEGLCANAIKVDKSFESVKRSLQRIQSNQAVSGNRPLLYKWSELQERWKALLWRSCEIANKAESHIKDFTQVIIPMAKDINDSDALEEFQKELSDFMKRNKEGNLTCDSIKQRPAQEHSDNYEKLRDDVGMFKTKFISRIPVSQLKKVEEELKEVTSKARSLENMYNPGFGSENISLMDEIQRCMDLLQKLTKEIKKINFEALYVMLGGILAPGALNSESDLKTVVIVGVAGLVIVGGLLLLKQYMDQGAAEKRERRREEELSRLHHRQERLDLEFRDLSRLKEQMNAQTPSMGDIYISLEGFEAVWAIVQHDAEIIGHDLDNILSTSSLSKMVFKRRLDILQANNESLAKALSDFAKISSEMRVSSAPCLPSEDWMLGEPEEADGWDFILS